MYYQITVPLVSINLCWLSVLLLSLIPFEGIFSFFKNIPILVIYLFYFLILTIENQEIILEFTDFFLFHFHINSPLLSEIYTRSLSRSHGISADIGWPKRLAPRLRLPGSITLHYTSTIDGCGLHQRGFIGSLATLRSMSHTHLTRWRTPPLTVQRPFLRYPRVRLSIEGPLHRGLLRSVKSRILLISNNRVHEL